MPPAWRARRSAPQGYARHSSRPCSTARRKWGARPNTPSTTWAKWRRETRPAPMARSTLRPPVGTVTRPRLRRPWRMSSRIRAMGAPSVWPPRATRSPSCTRAAAWPKSVQTGGIGVSRYGVMAQLGQQVEQDAGGGAPDHFLVVAPAADPGSPALEDVGAAAPALRGNETLQGQRQQAFH